MSYTALYRKFRPGHFDQVKGQDPIVTTLKNQIISDRIGHAYLFCGTRGTGKTSIAKLFAKAINCEAPVQGSPCGNCASCKTIASGASMNVIEIDAASNNGVDNIREIVDEVSYSPAEGRFKVYIIDEVHMLSIGAFNALLKTLEEPPSYVVFILATTEVHKIPITILSRCQRYDFRRITVETIAGRLRELMDTEQIRIEEQALRFIARMADGSMRDALSLLDQCIAFHFGQELTYEKVLDVLGAVDNQVFEELLHLVLQKNVAGCIRLLEEVVIQGKELTQFVGDFSWYLRNLLLIKTTGESTDTGMVDMEEMLNLSPENIRKLRLESQALETETILRYIRIFAELSSQMKYAVQKRILIEIALIKLCKPQMETDNDSLRERIRNLEERMEQGIFPAETSGDNRSDIRSTDQEPPEKILPKAIPEDIRTVVANWRGIVGNAGMPLKLYLKGARLSLGEEGNLVIVVEDGLAYDYLVKSSTGKETILCLIEDYLGKQVEIEIHSVADNRQFDVEYVDLSKIINMEIEEE